MFDVRAVISAVDKNFVSTFANASKTADSFGSKLKNGLSFGFVTAAGQKAFNMIGQGFSAVASHTDAAISRLDTLNNYPKVMKSLGYSTKEAKASISVLDKGITGLPTTMDGIAQSAQMLTATLGDLDKGSKSAVALNDMFLAGGQGAEAASRALTQYNQILAKGKVDQQSWNTLVEVAPAQMNQLAKTMLGADKNQKDLYESLQKGTTSIDDLNNAIIKLDQEGGDGFKSFSDQAHSATGGIGTSISNMKTAITKNLANTISAFDRALKKSPFGKGIADTFGMAKEGIDKAFSAIYTTNKKGNKVLTASAKQVVNSIGQVMSKIPAAISKVTSVVGKAVDGVKRFFNAFKETGALATIRPLLTSIAGAVKHVMSSFSGSGAIESLGHALGTVVSTLAKAATAVANFISSLKPGTIQGVAKALAGVAIGFKGISVASSVFGKIKSLNPFAKLKKNATGGLKAVEQGAKGGVSKIADIIRSLGDTVKNIGTGIATVFKGLGTGISTAFQGIGKGLALVSPVTLLALGAGIAVVCAGLTLLATQGQGVATIITSIGAAFGIFASMVVGAFADAIVTVSGVVPVICQGLAELSPLVVAIGEAIGAAAPGISAFGSVISGVITAVGSVVATVMPTITDAFVQIVPVVTNAVTSIISALAPFVPNIQSMVETLAPVMMRVIDAFETVVTQISPILDSLSTLVETCFTGISDTVTSIGDTITNVVTAIGDSISGVLDSIAGIFDSIGNAALNAGRGFDLLANGISTLVALPLGDMVATLKKTADGVSDIGKNSEGLPELGQGFAQLGSGIQKAGVFGQMAGAAFSLISDGLIMMSVAIEGLPVGMATCATAIQTFAASMTSTGTALLASVVSFMAIGQAVGQVRTSMIVLAAVGAAAAGNLKNLSAGARSAASGINKVGAAAERVQSKLTSIPGAVTSTAGSLKSLGAVGSSAMTTLASAFKQGSVQAKASMVALTNAVKTALKAGLAQVPSVATSTMSKFASGLRAGGSSVAGAARSVSSNAASAMRSGYSGAFSAGAYMSQGLANGIRSALSAISAAAAAAEREAERVIEAKAKIGSPSKKTKKLGSWMGKGLAIGLLNQTKSIKAASTTLAKTALKSMQGAKKGAYEKTADKVAKTYQTALEKKLNKAMKQVKKAVKDKKLSSSISSQFSKSMKAGVNKAVKKAQDAFKTLGKEYQAQYDAIIQKRKALNEKLSDYGSLFSSDAYGFVKVKDFGAATKQIQTYSDNLEALKKKGVSKALMEEIAQLSTADGLVYTNKLLKMTDKQLKSYSRSYTNYMNAAKTASNDFYADQLKNVQKNYKAAVTKEMSSLKKNLNEIGASAMQGFVNGMNKKAKSLTNASKTLANQVVAVFKKHLKIHSPSKVMASLGGYVGEGFANGIAESARLIEAVTRDIFTIPEVAAENARLGMPELSNDYEYGVQAQYTIVVPVNLDGKEVARITAPYTEAELDKLNRRAQRKLGYA